MLSEYLSIWELSHRWYKYDPNHGKPENLPLEVQDTMRFLCRLVLSGLLPLKEELFITNETEQGSNRFEHFIYDLENLPSAISDCAIDRKFDRIILDSYVIDRADLFNVTAHENTPFPDFWWDDSIIIKLGGHVGQPSLNSQEQKISTTRVSVIDKSICQAVAKTLWDIYPDMNITRMTKHPSILNHAGGKNYIGKNTLRDWVREVAPENIKNKPGRPKLNKSNNEKP